MFRSQPFILLAPERKGPLCRASCMILYPRPCQQVTKDQLLRDELRICPLVIRAAAEPLYADCLGLGVRPRKASIASTATAISIATQRTALWRSDHGRSSGRPVYSALCMSGPSCACAAVGSSWKNLA